MKAYLINAEQQQIEIIDINSMDEIIQQVGYDTIESDAVGDNGDTLYFDEECFLRGSTGRFQIDTLIPVSGIGIVIGEHEGELTDVSTELESLQQRIKYL